MKKKIWDSGDRDRPIAYTDRDTVMYRASAIGGCERALLAARLDAERHPVPAVMQKYFDQGHVNEPIIMDRWAADHPDYTLTTNDNPPAVLDFDVELDDGWLTPVQVVGTVDGLAAAAGTLTVVDAKAMSSSNMDKIIEKGLDGLGFGGHYLWQMAVYVTGLEADRACLAFMEKLDGVVTEKSRIEYIWLDKEQLAEQVDEIYAKIRRVEQTVYQLARHETRSTPGEGLKELADRLEELDIPMPACPADFACQYPQFHENKTPLELHDDDANELERATLYNTLAKKFEAEAKKYKDRSRGIIEGLMERHDGENRFTLVGADGGKMSVTWVRQEVAEATRVVKAHVREYPKFTVVEPLADDELTEDN